MKPKFRDYIDLIVHTPGRSLADNAKIYEDIAKIAKKHKILIVTAQEVKNPKKSWWLNDHLSKR